MLKPSVQCLPCGPLAARPVTAVKYTWVISTIVAPSHRPIWRHVNGARRQDYGQFQRCGAILQNL